MEAIPQSEKLDSRWYPRFESVTFEDYEKLQGSKEEREKQQAQFLAGEIENPQLDYPELDTFNFKEREETLVALKEDVLELEQNPAVQKIYRTKINEVLATLRMLRAAKEGDDRTFSRYADFIYGELAASDVNYVLHSVQEIVERNLASEQEERRAAAERLHAIIGSIDTTEDDGVDKSILPEGESIEGHIEGVDEAVEAFEEALQELAIDDWTVVVDTKTGLSNFSVSQEHKIVRVPSEEKLAARNLSKKKLKALIAHEIKTHVARRHNGERSKLQLLGLGLDRYIKAEEGIASYNEQLVMGADEFAGIPRYFSIAIAKGVDGTPRDFRRTFEILKDYRLLSSKKTTEAKAAETAYNDCVRIFRGTTGTTPGAVYSKDTAYFGNRDIWTLVSQNSDVVEQFSIGKFDPTNGEHVALLTELGILDEDLRNLEGEEGNS